MENSLGDQILKTVDEILSSGNLEKLNSVVSDTVTMAMDEVRKQMEKATADARKSVSGSKQEHRINTASGAAGSRKAYTPAPRAKIKRVGNVAGILLQVFGSIGTAGFGIASLVFLGIGVFGSMNLAAVILFGALAAAMASVIGVGAAKRERLKRAERYVQLMQGKAYNNIHDLALLANKSEGYVRRDLRKMIECGIFPEGHMNSEETCLILGDVAYREYIRMEKLRKENQLEAAEQKRIEQQIGIHKAAEAKTTKQKSEVGSSELESDNEELHAVIREGSSYIKKFRELNDLIEGEIVSAKLFRLENILKEIFAQLKKSPEQIPEMHKFMEYYLPTTLKLVTAYEEFDRVSVPGEDILSSKREIEKTLDTINMAFEELLNKLFRSRVYDVTTDAQVLKTMLAREGLTREPVFVSKRAGEPEQSGKENCSKE